MAEQNTQDVVKEAQSAGHVLPVDVNATSTSTTAGNGTAPSAKATLDSKPFDAPISTSSTSSDAPAATTSQSPDKAGGDASPQTLAANTDAQTRSNTSPAETKEQLTNGDVSENSAVESHPAMGEASGGSDTDISRPGSVDQAQRPGGHVRTNSIKKPASFKSVSVTKNFLAKSAVSAPSTRPGEKAPASGQATPSALPTARPRLVAKSGSGNVPRAFGKVNGAATGPDASKVWNKNQPIPPPPPKQFTDEELKQQYGIHLATRLQADEGGKEAKWADIDDDEDDWTPDTVQWMDGTKSTVAAVENEPPPPPPPEEPKTILQPTIVAKSTPPPPAAPQKTTLASSTTKTILKPGAHTMTSLSKQKGQTDKATLVAKPSAPTPVKSPWAPLPPVEKASPVHINPPVQPPSRYRRDSQGYDAMPPPPAKEIAPDDFNRPWRDERGNRELFNSHSGRYEPVREMRRGSVRDNNFRQQPSVLQRPLHDGPAEPSAAFQTSRMSADGPSWGRRRNSSNVSGDSGRHMLYDTRGPELGPISMNMPRRESQSINGADTGAAGMPRHGLPPRPLTNDQQPTAQAPRPSPSMSQAQPASPFGSITSQDPATPGVPPIQNLVEVQQRVMHDNIETIKQRKQREKEQEEKEEQERKERLRIKMEALRLSEESKKPKEASPSRPQKSPMKEKAIPVQVQSPPKPPVPSAEGEVAQYGMMKVHQAQPVKRPSAPGTMPLKPLATSPAQVKVNNVEPKPAPLLSQGPAPSNLTRDNTLPAEQSHPSIPTGPQGPKPSQAAQAPGPWSHSLPQQQQQQQRNWASNVWGPPQTKDRALGNGTFVQQVGAPSQPAQAPIGAKPALRPTSSHQQATPTQSFAQQAMYSRAGPATGQSSAAPKPAPIAPPLAKGWGDFHAQIRRDDRDMALKAQQNLERLGGETFKPEIHEVYIDQQGKSQTTLHSKVGGIDARPSLPNPAQEVKPKDEVARAVLEGPTPPHGLGQGPHAHPGPQGARSSRFFPRPLETAPQASLATTGDSPPPPETQSHPVYSGELEHPVVRMPKPAPRVRLPPAAVQSPVQPEVTVSMPPRSRMGPGMGSRPLALTAEWQARFNNLLDKTGGPAPAPVPATNPRGSGQAAVPKLGALAIAASSKAPLEVRESSTSATVSLPASTNKKIFTNDGSSEVTTRTRSDSLLEDREFGSLPTIRLTKVPHLAANEPPVGFPPGTRQNSRYPRWPEQEMFSKPSFTGEFEKNSESIEVRIKVGNMQEAVVKNMPRRRRNGKGPGQPKPRRNNYQNGSNGDSPSNGQNRGPRRPSNFTSQGNTSNGSPRPSPSTVWSNNRSTPSHTSQPWSRRTTSTAPVH
ncbi:hypothetical protein CC80DRAFT_535991 [Byssothecium circinans]|uniref:PI-PLC Y-box domain-containing protein n=1 Tax=Byssothecium circinans TaxID=147558 RepID=A0A6A5TUM5_9PLEO|nr:hypothetical protein CC80DRAFT_535991 [Byssothecium circinans]